MSPTLRASGPALETATGVGVPRRVRVYAGILLAGALVALVLAVVAGAGLPQPGAVLLLALPLALVVNRFVLFPNETGAMADAAVVLAAVVGFRADAVWVGPLLVALLVGPLDARHWDERAFVRMVYNSGSQAVVAVAAVAVFVPVSDAVGPGWAGSLVGAAVALVPYVAVETGCGVLLVALLGERAGDALRHQLPLNLLAVPLGLVGAAAGVAAVELGWWAAFLVLLPVPLVPELALVRRARPGAGAAAAGLLLAGGALVALAVVLDLPEAGVLALLVVLAVGAGAECRVDDARPVPVLAAAVVVAAVTVVPGDTRFLAAGLVALVATVAAWASRAEAPPASAPTLAVGAGLLAAAVVGLEPSSPASAAGIAATALAGVVCLVVTERRPVLVAWCAPVLGAAVVLATRWHEVGGRDALAFAVGTGGLLAASALFGAPPWRSRLLAAAVYPRWSARRAAVLVAAVLGAVAAAAVSLVGPRDARGAAWTTVVMCLLAALAMAMLHVRQWRFVPARRRRECVVLVVATVIVTLASAITARLG